jgi:hypothetical protein
VIRVIPERGSGGSHSAAAPGAAVGARLRPRRLEAAKQIR